MGLSLCPTPAAVAVLTGAARSMGRACYQGVATIQGRSCNPMPNAGSRILRSVQAARAYARGEVTEGFVVHVPESEAASPSPEPGQKPNPSTTFQPRRARDAEG